ncbi:Type III pantothenate kinase [Planktothrix serta PCC 8927]|uniref:Type III pantothenate kinase n=1 Tax=Planktothrix serta PCC 8927 TaxID=671068 RepID=A0A7Z9BUZ5_9CYAN|nr:pantothenate kinase [Planktothrix serta]VXD20080.1 Type III pantothenate kinase [Planktothrix serta PCC 8927]
MSQSPHGQIILNYPWFGLMLGNSRRHWAKLLGTTVLESWDEENTDQPPTLKAHLPLLVASVIPEQSQHWATTPQVRVLTLADIPLKGMYSTLGIDRALAVLGGGIHFGWPILVIDAGTALTLTGVDAEQRLVGGAILPGFGLQRSSLAQKTAALPDIEFPQHLPPRWAMQTSEAIQSGIIYTLLAGIRDFIEAWREQYPNTALVLTGGDRHLLLSYFTKQFPDTDIHPVADAHLIFRGMAALKTEHKKYTGYLVASSLQSEAEK